MTQVVSRNPVRIAFLIVLALALAAGFYWVIERRGAPMALDSGAVTVVARSGNDTLLVTPRTVVPASAGVMVPAVRDISATDAKILHALGIPPGSILSDLAPGDAAAQVICGQVALTPLGQARRFVFIGLAGLGAVDDDGAEFAKLRERMCTRL